MTVEQFLPAFHYGDAVSNSALALHRFLLRRGVASRLITLTCDEAVKDEALLFRDHRPDPDSLKILHFAIPSPLTDFFLEQNGKKVLIYHNITPARFFAGYSDFLVRFVTAGREHLGRLRDCFDLSLGVSQFNAGELRDLGFREVRVFPLLVDLDDYAREPSRAYMDLLENERRTSCSPAASPRTRKSRTWSASFFYKKYISPAIRLIVVGNTRIRCRSISMPFPIWPPVFT